MSYGDSVQLGKISKVSLGTGGYQGAMFGLSVTLSFDGGNRGCSDFKGSWSKRPNHAEYSEDEFLSVHHDTYDFIREIMMIAKVDDISKLVGVPIEAKFDGMRMKSWRVLSEVL